MKWTPGGSDEDVEDRRDESGGGGGGGIGGSGIGGIHLGIGGTIIVGVLSLIFHQNFFSMLSGPGGGQGGDGSNIAQSQPNPARTASEKPLRDFVVFVLDDVQDNWDRVLPAEGGRPYHHARLVLYRDAWPSGCGTAQTATGPFYCPEDGKVYVDLGFFDELQNKFGAPGQFAQAYVIAHEIGHHVQKILGIEPKVRQLEERNPREANPLSVKLELQADCFAGVWGNSTEQRKLVNDSDIEAGLRAAASVGDDRLQKMATGHVSPDSFTHGSSAQRVSWFRKGLENGKISACNTFQDQ